MPPPTTFGATGHILDMRDSIELVNGCGGKRKCDPLGCRMTMTGTSLANDELAAAFTSGTRRVRSKNRELNYIIPGTVIKLNPALKYQPTTLPPAPSLHGDMRQPFVMKGKLSGTMPQYLQTSISKDTSSQPVSWIDRQLLCCPVSLTRPSLKGKRVGAPKFKAVKFVSMYGKNRVVTPPHSPTGSEEVSNVLKRRNAIVDYNENHTTDVNNLKRSLTPAVQTPTTDQGIPLRVASVSQKLIADPQLLNKNQLIEINEPPAVNTTLEEELPSRVTSAARRRLLVDHQLVNNKKSSIGNIEHQTVSKPLSSSQPDDGNINTNDKMNILQRAVRTPSAVKRTTSTPADGIYSTNGLLTERPPSRMGNAEGMIRVSGLKTELKNAIAAVYDEVLAFNPPLVYLS